MPGGASLPDCGLDFRPLLGSAGRDVLQAKRNNAVIHIAMPILEEGPRLEREQVTSVGAVVVAFLASAHHWLHMLVMTVGLGHAAAAGMAVSPVLRYGMSAMAVLMTGLSLVHLLRKRHRPRRMVMVVSLSAVISLGLVAYNLLSAV